jgi:hypothetical protein
MKTSIAVTALGTLIVAFPSLGDRPNRAVFDNALSGVAPSHSLEA